MALSAIARHLPHFRSSMAYRATTLLPSTAKVVDVQKRYVQNDHRWHVVFTHVPLIIPPITNHMVAPKTPQEEKQETYMKYREILLTAIVSIAATGAIMTFKERYNEPTLEKRMKPYFAFLDQYPELLGPRGSAEDGEFELVRNLKIIEEIENKFNVKVGIHKTPYLTHLIDPVKTKTGYGIHSRIFWNHAVDGISGVVVLPINPDNTVTFVGQYEHNLRRIIIGLPRGNARSGESEESAAARKLGEKTGAIAYHHTSLGKVNPDPGVMTGDIRLTQVEVGRFDPSKPIAMTTRITVNLTIPQIEEGIRKGSVKVKLDGEMQEVEFGTDGFTRSALLQAHLMNGGTLKIGKKENL